MYTVIICPECEYPQIVADDPETTSCQRCNDRLPFRKLKRFFHSEELKPAQHARASIAAQQQGFGEEFNNLDLDIDTGAVTDRIGDEFLAAHGLDSNSLQDAAADDAPKNLSRPDIVRNAVRECDPATEEAIKEYAEANGVPASKAVDLLNRMYERGDTLRTNGAYRLV